MDGGAWRLQSTGLKRVRNHWATLLSLSFKKCVAHVGQEIEDSSKYMCVCECSNFNLTLSSVQFSRWVVSDSLQPHELQHTRPPCPQPTPGIHPDPCPLSRWCHPTIPSSSPFLSALNLSQHQGLFQWVSSSHQVAKVLEFQLQHQSFQWTPRTDLL